MSQPLGSLGECGSSASEQNEQIAPPRRPTAMDLSLDDLLSGLEAAQQKKSKVRRAPPPLAATAAGLPGRRAGLE